MKTLILSWIMFGIFWIVEKWNPVDNPTALERLKNMVCQIPIVVGGALTGTAVGHLIPCGAVWMWHSWWVSCARLTAYLCLFDLLFYLYHRAQHSVRVLWLFHRFHHTEVALNATTAGRSNWMEGPCQGLLAIIPFRLCISGDLGAGYLLPVLVTFWVIFNHSNLRLGMGILTRVIVGPQVHRIHHSILRRHWNKNFAEFFPVFDILFGTYYHPGWDEFPPTGLAK